ncbi:MAG TPA: hypothetical protein VHH33_09655 [Nitrososphaeraceae archaeon]|jgi:hypothetical protein|nr:hypothetical protein [Nitrososphaeraceae archaeon]
MEKSNGTKIAVTIVAFSLVLYSIYFNQMVLAEELELKSVGKGGISCDGGDEINGVKINFFMSYYKGTSFAEWNIDHQKLGSAGGIITEIKTSSHSFVLKGVEAFDNICDNETPSDINLSGHCGAGTIKLVSDNGNKGTFTSNVICG